MRGHSNTDLTGSLIKHEDDQWLTLANKNPEWRDFSIYVAHLFNEHENLTAMLANLDTDLRNTYGYRSMRAESQEKSRRLLEVSERYIRHLAQQPGVLKLADTTGFNPESVKLMLGKMRELNKNLKHSDWLPDSLFDADPNQGTLARLYGVLLSLPEFGNLRDISNKGLNHSHIAKITADWVGGMTIEELAKTYFEDEENLTQKITWVCRTIYRHIATDGAWGLSSLMQTAGLQDAGDLSDEEKRKINMLPSMIFHGVHTEEAVLMRMNSVPRRIAENLGSMFSDNNGDKTAVAARNFLRVLPPSDWHDARPQGAVMDGKDYKKIWQLLSGYDESR